MTQCRAEDIGTMERREYQRKWRANNKEKVKQHQADYWRRKAEKKQAKQEK